MTPDDQVRQLVDAAVDRLVKDIAPQVRTALESLVQTVGSNHETSIQRAREASESKASETLAAALTNARAEAAENLQAELGRTRAEAAETLSAAIVNARREAAKALEAEVARVRAETGDASAAELARVKSEAERSLTDRLAALETEAERRVSEAHTTAERSLTAARAHFEQQLGDTRAELEHQMHARIEETVAQRVREAEGGWQEHAEARIAEARSAAERDTSAHRVQERLVALSEFDRLLKAIQRLDQSRSLSESLTALGDAVREQAARAGIFLVNGDLLRAWRLEGFHGRDPRGVEIPIADAGIMADALKSANPRVIHNSDHSISPVGLEFVTLPPNHAAMAIPVLIGSQVVAVVYADEAGEGERRVAVAGPEVIEILVRHAGRTLETLTAQRTTQAVALANGTPQPVPKNPSSASASTMPAARAQGSAGSATSAPQPMRQATAVMEPPAPTQLSSGDAEALRIARSLISEIKLYNEAAVSIGRQKRDLLRRLRPEIDHAREIYEQQTGGSKSGIFDEELVRTLAEGDASLLGHPKFG